jgi:hypothetical protein
MTGIATSVDAARVELLLNELRLPGVKAIWPKLAAQSDKEGWPAARFLADLAEHEAPDRTRRRIERHMVEARLPASKTLATFDFESVPMLSKAIGIGGVSRLSPPTPPYIRVRIRRFTGLSANGLFCVRARGSRWWTPSRRLRLL